MTERIFHVDAFTEHPFAGNPAAVCLLSQERAETWMQAIAREMNLSETAFVRCDGDVWSLRWFTPAVEVELCGHATLASAHVLWEQRLADERGVLRFSTKSGELRALRGTGVIELDFPAERASECAVPANVLAALGAASARHAARNRFDLLLELEDESAVRSLSPDFPRLIASSEARGVIATARSDRAEFDFVSRFFAPAVGIDEDPVTGSAHCCLGPYWAERLGKQRLQAYQASSRGGKVSVHVTGERVMLGGSAATIARGELVQG